ncbi:hypothetical protein T439DRAFT_328062 [Meredithblackwellia eburnea MCA 4105]
MFSQAGRDKFFYYYLLVHIPITLLIDGQAIFCSKSIYPSFLRPIYDFASKDDPLLQNNLVPWFQTFIVLEMVFQLPVFVIGAIGLKKRSPKIYPLLTIYGTSCATTTLACLSTVIFDPRPSVQSQLPKLLGSYVPFLLIPLSMAVDYGSRLVGLVGEKSEEKRE